MGQHHLAFRDQNARFWDQQHHGPSIKYPCVGIHFVLIPLLNFGDNLPSTWVPVIKVIRFRCEGITGPSSIHPPFARSRLLGHIDLLSLELHPSRLGYSRYKYLGEGKK